MSKSKVNWELLLPLLLTTIVAVCGWVVGHRFNAERDLHNKRVELRIRYLLEAYRNLENSVEDEVSRENLDFLESAVADIQLLGSADQVSKILEWWDTIKDGEKLKNVNLGPLLEDLRTSLRSDLGLEPIGDQIRHIRLHLSSEKEDQD